MIGKCGLNEVGGLALLEQQRDIVFQRRLVALDGEMIVRLALDQIGCQRALGQQGIARDVLAGDITAFKQRLRHADFVGELELFPALYG